MFAKCGSRQRSQEDGAKHDAPCLLLVFIFYFFILRRLFHAASAEKAATGTDAHFSSEDGLKEGGPLYAVVDKSKKKKRAPGSSITQIIVTSIYLLFSYIIPSYNYI